MLQTVAVVVVVVITRILTSDRTQRNSSRESSLSAMILLSKTHIAKRSTWMYEKPLLFQNLNKRNRLTHSNKQGRQVMLEIMDTAGTEQFSKSSLLTREPLAQTTLLQQQETTTNTSPSQHQYEKCTCATPKASSSSSASPAPPPSPNSASSASKSRT